MFSCLLPDSPIRRFETSYFISLQNCLRVVRGAVVCFTVNNTILVTKIRIPSTKPLKLSKRINRGITLNNIEKKIIKFIRDTEEHKQIEFVNIENVMSVKKNFN